jgi:hypothetical protein
MLNKYNLPEYVCNSLYTPYKPNPHRFGATSIIEPPLIRTLKQKYWNKLKEDVADKLWMIHGNSLDAFIKHHSRFGLCNLKFERVWGQDAEGNDVIVVIKPDYYNVIDHVLADLKDSSVWTVINGKQEYVEQLNIYDCVMHLEQPELVVDSLELHVFAKDWKANDKLRYGKDYPACQFSVLDIKRWDRDFQMDFIDTKLKDHLENPMRECTPKEKWSKPDEWAVKKKGNKTARGGKVCKSRHAADKFIDDHPDKQWEIEYRPGKDVRCEGYCNVAEFCPYVNNNTVKF